MKLSDLCCCVCDHYPCRCEPSAPDLYITPYPDGIRVICGDLDRLHAMSPKAMRGFAIRLLAMAECKQ